MVCILLLAGCNQSDHRTWEPTAPTDAPVNSESIAPEAGNPVSGRKFIRTADLKFKVKDVAKATENIEHITTQNGGFVTYTHLSSQISGTNITVISKDSSLRTTYYTVANNITIRIPNQLLDTTLKAIAQNIDFLDHRTIKAEDVALQILSNQLVQKRNTTDEKYRESRSFIRTDEYTTRKKELSDEAKIANLSLNDQVNFSTVHLSLYQDTTIQRELIANEKNTDAYQPGLGSRLADSFKVGWDIIENIVVYLAQLWAFFLMGLIIYFLYRKYRTT